MSEVTESLLKELLNNPITVAIYGGGFKPPTKGHFTVAQEALKELPDIDELKIFVGGGVRDGITQNESVQIWKIYQPYLSDKIEVEPVSSPVKAVLDYAKENPDEKVYWVLGAREGDEDDLKDIEKRTKSLDKYPNIEVKIITTAGGVSGTKTRASISSGNKEEFFNLIPNIQEKEEIWNILSPIVKEGIVDNMKTKIKDFISAVKQESQETKQALSLLLKAAKGEIKLNDEQKEYIGNQLKDVLKLVGLTAIAVLPGGSIAAILLKVFKQTHFITPSSFLNKVELINENQVATAAESFYLNIPKFNQPKTVQQYLIESINEISLSKENAAKINGDLTGGTFTVGDITYEYSIKNIPNPYKDLGLFYNIQFTPSGEVTSIPKGGKENYIKILSTMYKIILDFIEKEQPTYVGISSLDNSGDKNYHTVYNRLTSNHMDFIPGYFRKDSNLTFDSPQGKGRFIVLKKKDNLDEKKSKDSFGLNAYARELVKETFKEDWNLKEGMLSLSRYMIDNGMNIKPLPKIKVIDNDAENASNLLGKTAYYNPVEKSITLFTMNRHPKDVLRSFAHEMVHHMQNLEGRLNNISTQNTNEDGDLPEIEREAYEKGNMMLRNWEDNIKNV
jgi:hypothetical protein